MDKKQQNTVSRTPQPTRENSNTRISPDNRQQNTATRTSQPDTEDDNTTMSPNINAIRNLGNLYVTKQLEPIPLLNGFKTKNKFKIEDVSGRTLYYAVDDPEYRRGHCPTTSNPFLIRIMDTKGIVIMELYRPLTMCGLCCYYEPMEVTAPPGNLLGTVEASYCCLWPTYTIKNNYGETIVRIQGPFRAEIVLGRSVLKFEIFTRDGVLFGIISKKMQSYIGVSDDDHFHIDFPSGTDVNIKAMLLATAFLIEFMLYEPGKSSILQVRRR